MYLTVCMDGQSGCLTNSHTVETDPVTNRDLSQMDEEIKYHARTHTHTRTNAHLQKDYYA